MGNRIRPVRYPIGQLIACAEALGRGIARCLGAWSPSSPANAPLSLGTSHPVSGGGPDHLRKLTDATRMILHAEAVALAWSSAEAQEEEVQELRWIHAPSPSPLEPLCNLSVAELRTLARSTRWGISLGARLRSRRLEPPVDNLLRSLPGRELLAVSLRGAPESSLEGFLVVIRKHHSPFGQRERRLARAFGGAVIRVAHDWFLFRATQERVTRLQRSGRARLDFLAHLSDELRTPLNSVIGFSEVLLDTQFGSLSERQHRYVTHILNSGQHLLNLVGDILDLLKIEAGRLELRVDPFSLIETLEIIETMVRLLAEHRGVTIEVRADPTIGLVSADPGRFRQVVFNLLANAVRSTPAGGLVAVRAYRIGPQDLGVSVQDSGHGIRPEDLPLIFNEFAQVTSSRLLDGTGLELALTKRLVELHGGDIGVESEPGRGTCFSFTLPGAIVTVNDTPQGSTHPGTQEGSPRPLILVVEDNSKAAELLRGLLERHGYLVATVAKGDEVVERATSLQPMAITMDLLLEGRDGWEVLRDLKSDPATRDIPVLIVSGVQEDGLGISLGAADYLMKPVAGDDLLAALDRLPVGCVGAGRSPLTLLADDDPLLLEMLTDHLKAQGIRVVTADGGDEAIRLARERRPDAVVLDLMMPGVTGFDVIQALSTNSITRQIPVLVLTAKCLAPEERETLRGRVKAIVQKEGRMFPDRLLEQLLQVERLFPERAGMLDPETGSFGPAYFRRRLLQEVRSARRTRTSLGLLVFQATPSHHAGGELRSSTLLPTLETETGGGAVLGRLDDTTFGVILPGVRRASLAAAADRLAAALQPGSGWRGIGLALFPEDGSSAEMIEASARESLLARMHAHPDRA